MNTTPRIQAPSREVWQRPFVKAHQKWCDDFVVELRLLDVPGPVIGDRLGEVETHCVATGDTPADAFGDPVSYAAQIAQESATEPVSGVWKITVLSAVQVLAMMVGTTAVTDWAQGEDLSYNIAQVGFLALFVLALLCLPKIISPLVRHPWAVGVPLAFGLPLLGVGAAFSGQFDLPVVLDLPAALMAMGLFAVVVILAWLEYRELAGDLDDNLVTSPLSPAPGVPATSGNRRRWIAILPACLIPLAYLVLAAFGWIFA